VRNLRLLGDRLAIQWEPEPERQVASSLIIIPETARTPANSGRDRFTRLGRVIATGPGDRCGVPQHEMNPGPQGGTRLSDVLPCEGETCPRCHGTGYLPMECKVGDRVWYDHNSGNEFTIDGQELVIAVESRVIMILED